jgi:hypothetical protein
MGDGTVIHATARTSGGAFHSDDGTPHFPVNGATPTRVDIGDVQVDSFNWSNSAYIAVKINGIDYGGGDNGNTFATATPKTLPYASENASVGFGSDTDDYIKFVATSDGTVSASLTGMSAELDLWAYDANQTAITTGGIGIRDKLIQFSVWSGQTYYIHVDPWGVAASSYSLSVQAISPPDTGSVSISDVTTSEGNGGTKVATFTAIRAGGTAAFAVNYATANNSALAGSDYVAQSGTLSFGTNVNAQTVSVTINGDTAIEPTETFFVNLSGATNGATISDSQGIGTITNDDQHPTVISILAQSADKEEASGGGTSFFTFTVTRSGDASGSSSAQWQMNPTQAPTVDGNDFSGLTSGTLTWGPCELGGKQVLLNVVRDDTFEANESFVVALSNAVGATINPQQASATGVIRNDDPPPPDTGSVSISDVTISEGNGGTKLLTFTATRSGGTAAFAVNYATANNSALAGSDYVAQSGTLFFGTGVNSQAVSVTINGDTAVEPTETFFVNLSGATNGATISDGQGVGTITNDDVVISKPDLTTSNLSVDDTTVGPGQNVTIAYQINNIGPGAAGAFDAGAYLSSDPTVTTADTLISFQPFASLSGNASMPGNMFGTLPSGLTPGATYWIGVIADDLNTVPDELSENNNTAAIAVTVKPRFDESHDFNGDERSDILWRHSGGGVVTWHMDAAQDIAQHWFGAHDPSWKVLGVGDFGGDGRDDLLWRHDGGGVAMWQMNGGEIAANNWVDHVDPNWKVVETGDFNGDGRSDIVWRHDGGAAVIWEMNGAGAVTHHWLGVHDPSWRIAEVADFGGDGRDDFLWRHDGGGVAMWQMDGGQVIANDWVDHVDPSWKIPDTGDFSGDGKADIAGRHDGGGLVTWHMNGAQDTAQRWLGAHDTSWKIARTGDFGGDGKDDLLWRHDGGGVVMWQMNGGQIVGNDWVDHVDPGWSITA